MEEQGNDRSGSAGPAGGPAESMGSAPKPDPSFGTAPGGDGGSGQGTFGSAPGPSQNMGDAPKSSGNKNIPLLVGGGIGILVVLAAILGFVIR
jgi:hypothetical protein